MSVFYFMTSLPPIDSDHLPGECVDVHDNNHNSMDTPIILLAIETFLGAKNIKLISKNNHLLHPMIIRLLSFALSRRSSPNKRLPPSYEVLNLDMRGRVTFMYIFLFNYSRDTITIIVLLNASSALHPLTISC